MNESGNYFDIGAKSVPQEIGWVYFIQAGDAVKIGYSTNPEKRMESLQTGASHTLLMLGKVPGTRGTEHMYQTRFANMRLKGEWFEACGPLLCAIDTIIRMAERKAKGRCLKPRLRSKCS